MMLRSIVAAIAIGIAAGEVAQQDDWLLQGLGPSPARFAATLEAPSPSEIRLQNGLVRRSFTTTDDGGLCVLSGTVAPNLATSLANLVGRPYHPQPHGC